MTSFIKIDEVLISKMDITDSKYKESRDNIYNSAKEISTIIGKPEDDFEVLNFVADYFNLKKDVPKITEVESCIGSLSVGNKDKFLPLLLSIRLRDFVATGEEIVKFFSLLSNKAKFSAADLGDENNSSFLQIAVKVINLSYEEQIEMLGVKHKNNIANVITDEFKNNLWKRVDAKIELLKTLKEDIYGDNFFADMDDEKVVATIGTSAKSRDDLSSNISNS